MAILTNYTFNEKTPKFHGAQADVYIYEKYALKVYKHADKKADAFYEALILSIIESNKFITPKIYQVTKTTNWTLVMDYIQGDLVADILDQEGTDLFDETIRLQVEVNNTICYLPFRVKDKIKNGIHKNSVLDAKTKAKLVNVANFLADDNYLCHGDFHARNLIRTSDGIAIIDWIDAAIGDSIADGCRSYLLYKLYYNTLADYYLTTYCKYRNIDTGDLLRILPAVAGARLSENNEKEHSAIFEIIRTHL